MSFALQIPCVMQHFYPETMANLIKLCANAKYTVTIPENQTCCGLPYFEKGELKTAKAIGEYNLSVFGQHQVVCGSEKCCETFTVKYPKIFNNTVSHNESMALSKNTTSLDTLFGKLSLPNVRSVNGRYFFVRNCQMQASGPAAYLTKFPEAEWILPKMHATSCGADACMPVNNRSDASKMAMALLDEAVDAKVDFMITEDDVCRKHLQNIADENLVAIKILHIIDLFAQAI
jgi:L-lactate dehydrogenase complex protein LldE